jgi:hypothetical protein
MEAEILDGRQRHEVVPMNFPQIKKDHVYVAIMALVILVIFLTGEFSVPWLHDNDPYEHASAVRFISEFGHPFQSAPFAIHYLTPYPPLYDILATIFYKISFMSIPASLKVFNALLCALAIPAFYLWSKTKFGDRVSLWSTFIIFSLPSFMSHFIWAQSLAILLMFPAMYLFEKRSKWAMPAMALVMIAQPSVAAIFTLIMLIYAWFSSEKSLTTELKINPAPFIEVGKAVALAFLVFWLPMFLMYGVDQVMSQITFSAIYMGDTSGGIVYSLQDFIDAPRSTKIDQPTGLGLAAFLLTIGGLVLVIKDKNWFLLALFAFCLIGIEGNLLPVKLFPHRFWVFLAIPVAILSANASTWLIDALKRLLEKHKSVTPLIGVALVLFVLFTCFAPKAEVEMTPWNGMFVTQNQSAGWVGLQTALPQGSMVFAYCSKEQLAEGMGFRSLAWDKEVIDHKSLNFTSAEDFKFLKSKGYGYALIDISCMFTNNETQVNNKIQQLLADPDFKARTDLSNSEIVVFEVKSP